MYRFVGLIKFIGKSVKYYVHVVYVLMVFTLDTDMIRTYSK